MSIADRIRRFPLPYDRDRGADVAAAFAGLPEPLSRLIEGAAGCSPYLAGLLMREALWFDTIAHAEPEVVLGAELSAVEAAGIAGGAGLAAALRQAKRRVALLVALCDLGGVWALSEVTGALTALSDHAVQAAIRSAVADEIRRGRIPDAKPGDEAWGAGMFVLAMGKTGAGELNYSSDIDLICLFDDERFPGAEAAEARTAFIRATRRMTSLLSDATQDGYVFRTDLRLRPDASVTPVCISAGAALGYYESVGRTWERAAHIKARPCAGDIAAGERYLEALRPFVWRKNLDFAAVQDIQEMRQRIRDHRGLGGPLALEGRNLKLGTGGIREIEFFAQTRQLIAGGRDPDLRVRGTEAALAALAAKGWIPKTAADRLCALYREHREVEHRLQMINDAQTHDLPVTAEGFDRLARFCGSGDTEAFRAEIVARLDEVVELTGDFFTPSVPASGPALSAQAQAVVDGWPAYPALRSARARELFARIRPEILSRMQRAAHPEEALGRFDSFLRGLPAGVQVFSLFDANPTLVDLIVDICATAPRLAAYLSRNATVLDAVIGGSFFSPWPGVAALRADLVARVGTETDYERQLDAARRWMKEWHFRIGVHHLRALIDAFESGQQYAELAEAVVSAVWEFGTAEFARRHGPMPGRGAVLMGMGSLGAGRLNAASDLDLIVIYDAAGVEMSEGPRPLAARTYYARLTQALLTAHSAPTAEGHLYEVDMRLRPSGRAGPVATSLGAFRDYQRTEAWTWEHLAQTRARVLAGGEELALDVENFRRELLVEKSGGETVRADVQAMRLRLQEAKPGSTWDGKLGRGRLQDIELLAQTCALLAGDPARRVETQILAGRRTGVLSREEAEAVLASYRLCWRLVAAARLLTDGPLDPATVGAGGMEFLLRETGAESLEMLAAELRLRAEQAGAVADRVLG
ncbi:glutamine-synthetase adenylyltransferase [Haematobacter massiliensis]|uniref:[protein-PII] uridylyltransferase family protein n=1 Tax=Haematobacter massiliensis TaxID=195105 RepID=UPI000B49D000|nr:glutamine-synthetase adenylyltransferase [Haematobacter massiliensis]OWJ72593.1 glutamine-synthetase adenylyltransferase [Haematobacter massiliensis]QBJ24373.1 glutamine-synthetase adenylyltransferase [Haematobacter massiliensis]